MPRRRSALVTAEDSLRGIDPRLDALIEGHGPCQLPSPAPAPRRFHDLVESIAYQQLHGSAAAAIWGRVCVQAGSEIVTPELLLAAGEEALRSCGLSGAKTRSMLDISLRVAEGEIRLDRIGRRSDEEIITALTAAWGIGPWTAQMFLMFTLGRLDVWPVGDYGVRVGFGKAWGMAEAPSEREMVELGAPFVGGRSVLAWYCWRAADTQSAKS